MMHHLKIVPSAARDIPFIAALFIAALFIAEPLIAAPPLASLLIATPLSLQ
jgi:hypothetical protein